MNHAVHTAPQATGHLILKSIETPELQPHEAQVQVEHISINRGEAFVAQFAPEGLQLGWDFSGKVVEAAADGSGPKAGTRVMGLLPMGAWARFLAVPALQLCEVPESISLQQAAALPVAGLTAHFSLQKAGNLQQKKVLVTGATGGVGHLAVQLAHLGGAEVTAQIRNPEQALWVEQLGATHVLTGDPASWAESGPFDVIVDGVGGEGFAVLPALLARDGMLICYGASAGNPVQLNLMPFTMTGGLSLQGIALFQELQREDPATVLAFLIQQVAAEKLKVRIEKEASWTEMGSVAEDLLARKFSGKAILKVE
ncbi:zinc-binding dehydrogenase [Deinococcus cellulosilyticus]|uniref:Oxidoreductase n=1 Tax=Deinococcus cellulosilyticus (strain DSM 18568 / NBRC 106333 / KACC 11606 / 5516J-15) TaxID=1223518 RepID=A0A511N5C7_DEIC1|nr:zinc-binding dehydrogenase [Deinococcus cellulosilyticus]GEM48059.1 oxidoreductase [Deinococcus cellulosilyticus NBRC 106333 = KACC 11606]